MKLKEFFEQPIILKSGRLLLKPLSVEHKESLIKIAQQTETLFYYIKSLKDAEQRFGKLIVWMIRNMKSKKSYRWSIFLNDNPLEAVGIIHIHDLKARNKSVKIGYILNKNFWNKEIISEATKLITDHLLNNLNVNRIMAEIDPNNKGSIRVVEKNGFSYEGTLRQAGEACFVYDRAIYAKFAD